MNAIIFDLDLTLVDSTIAEEARKRREWSVVYSLIPQFILYRGFQEVFDYIRSKGIKVAIVSTAPSSYVQRVVNLFHIPVHTIVGYHDATRKPSPAGMLLAIERLNASPGETISFGDRDIDIIASRAAGIKSVACTWGAKDYLQLISSRPDLIINNANDILSYI